MLAHALRSDQIKLKHIFQKKSSVVGWTKTYKRHIQTNNNPKPHQISLKETWLRTDNSCCNLSAIYIYLYLYRTCILLNLQIHLWEILQYNLWYLASTQLKHNFTGEYYQLKPLLPLFVDWADTSPQQKQTTTKFGVYILNWSQSKSRK